MRGGPIWGGGILLAGLAGAFPGRGTQDPESAPASVPVERCLECHAGAARDVASGAHASLENRCTGCHGGNPSSFDERRAHTGKFRAVPLAACAACHEAEADAFAGGPHGVAFETKAIRGCVECHSFHAVPRPDHALLRTACRTCHETNAPETVESGRQTADDLDRLDSTLAAAARALDEAERRARIVRQEREGLEADRLARLALLPKQHAMDLEPFRSDVAALRARAESTGARAAVLLEETGRRRRWAWLVGALVAANALAILWRRRTLPNPDSPP